MSGNVGEIAVQVKFPDSVAVNDKIPKVWSKVVTDVNMSKPGGWCLVGTFYKGSTLIGSNMLNYHVSQDMLKGNISVACVDFDDGPSLRAVFVIAPSSLYGKAPSEFSVTTCGAQHDAKLGRGSDAIQITVSLPDNSMFITGFVNHEAKKGKNSLVSAAEYIKTYLKTSPALSLSKAAAKLVEMPLAATPEKLVPVKKTPPKKKRKKSSRKQIDIDPDRHIVFETRPKIAVPGKGLYIPDGVEYLADIDGLKIMSVQGKPRMMHVLADFENVTEEVRELMVEQAKLLEAFAAAYRLVATIEDKGD